jgi:phosphoglycolate phosphatase
MKLLFDLDGTLTDPGCGIVRCLQHALAGVGAIVPAPSELTWCIGPPLQQSLRELLGTSGAPLVDRALALYRERFTSIGIFENTLYPDVRDALLQLRDAGHRLWVVTSKPHVYARRILAHFDLLDMFMGVYGSELSGEHSDKASLVRYALDTERWDPRPCLIGDRRHDVEAAHANGLEAVGVLWGYGSRSELEAAGADVLVASMPELVEWVRGQKAQRQGDGGGRQK